MIARVKDPNPPEPIFDPTPEKSDFIPIENTTTVEESILIPNPNDKDKNLEDVNQPFDEPAGEDPLGKANDPFRGPVNVASIGVGGGGAGDMKGRGSMTDRRLYKEGDSRQTKATEGAVLAALRWLARHQNTDGSWCAETYDNRCGHGARAGRCDVHAGNSEFNAGVTGLSLLSFLGAGYSHFSKDTHDGICFGKVIKNGLQWMMKRQDAEGCIGGRSCDEYIYNHIICTLALTEAYGLTGSDLLREPAQQAVDFIVAARNPDRVWRYSARCGENDTSVTGWAVMALKSAEMSGLSFPREECYGAARSWLKDVTDTTYYRVGYNAPGTGKVHNGHNAHFDHHDALAAISVMSRIFMDRNRTDPAVRGGCQLLVKDLPSWNGVEIDFYYWYYASLALFQYDGPSGRLWGAWNEHLVKALVPNQRREKKACFDGSWDPVGRWCHDGDRVYATAINALTLEVYYRYANAFTGDAH